ncbi:MAG TPA: hypothetical protein VL171_01610 [Verrucomicrobiae bacterium]|nr:hypothetical protein [Verrucomicrobiae bacterium]
MNEVINVSRISNREFLETYAQPGRVGLVGGTTWIEKVIRRAERHLDAEEQWSLWSHTTLFEGKRVDGHHWVIESDLQIHRKHMQLGVQENRIAKYYNEEMFPNLAVLDFGLSDKQFAAVLGEGLRMVALHAVYSLRELVGAAFALRHQRFRSQRNLLARRKSMYCSGFVQYVFARGGVDLVPGVHASHGSPEDISRTAVPHTIYVIQRQSTME